MLRTDEALLVHKNVVTLTTHNHFNRIRKLPTPWFISFLGHLSLHWDHLIRKHTFSYEMKLGMTGNSIKTLKLFVYPLRDIAPALHNTHYLLCSSLAPVYHDNEEHCLTSLLICLLQRICFCASHVDENVTSQIYTIYSKVLQNARLVLRLHTMTNGCWNQVYPFFDPCTEWIIVDLSS